MSDEKILDEDPRLDNEHWAGVLVQALPYFKHWVGKIVVVKYGGNAMLNEELKHDVMEDIVLLSTIGIHVVLVHGGGPEINNMLQRVGKESKFVNGLRYTDEGPENYVGDNYLANDSLQEADGHVYVIIDSHEDHAKGLDLIRNAGGVVIDADTVDDLADQLQAYKVNPFNLKKTIAEYQEAAEAGATLELTIPKTAMPTGYLTKLDTPPFHAVQASAGISGFYGGIQVTDDCAVLGNGDQVIPNLYAAPMASGGYFYKEYGGGLALCATFGAVAGKAAGENAAK